MRESGHLEAVPAGDPRHPFVDWAKTNWHLAAPGNVDEATLLRVGLQADGHIVVPPASPVRLCAVV